MQEVVALAREHAADAIATLAAIMKDSAVVPAARVAAANSLLERGFGKPVQEVSGPDGSPLKIIVATGIERGNVE